MRTKIQIVFSQWKLNSADDAIAEKFFAFRERCEVFRTPYKIAVILQLQEPPKDSEFVQFIDTLRAKLEEAKREGLTATWLVSMSGELGEDVEWDYGVLFSMPHENPFAPAMN